jgi:hypothetical protein
MVNFINTGTFLITTAFHKRGFLAVAYDNIIMVYHKNFQYKKISKLLVQSSVLSLTFVDEFTLLCG